MVDIVDAETRSRMMRNIRGKDTKPELLLRHALHARGFRYRLHEKGLPGQPDLVFPKYRAAVFVHGCFWHRHPPFAPPPLSFGSWRGEIKRAYDPSFSQSRSS